jgi:site-specific DNA recombinase
MSRKTNQKAIIYARVGTKRQSLEGNGLTSQETRCREYAGYRGHEVIAVFTDNMSGGVATRPGFEAMIKFIRANRKKGLVVVIDDISRMARDVRAHFMLKQSITNAGASLESPSIEFGENSDALFVEHVLASAAQHQRQKNGERTHNRMRARMMGGFYVHTAPFGYAYVDGVGGGRVLVPDEPLASIIAEALNGFVQGRFNSKAEVRRFLESQPAFPKNKHGTVTNQQAHRVLTRPIYAGYLDSKAFGLNLRKAHHQGLITLETFERNQAKLAGKAYAPARVDVSEDFPLRGFVNCGCCNHPMTANWTKGRNNHYPYYVCRHRGCEMWGKSVARGKIDDRFVDLLQAITPAPERVERLEAQLRQEWQQRNSRQTEARTDMKQQIKAIEGKIAALLDRIMDSDSPTVISAYERKVEQLERDKLVLQEKTARCGTALGSFDASFRTALDFLAKPCDYWEKGTLEGRRTVLKLALASPLHWDWNEGVRTAEISMPFKVLNTEKDWKNEMAEGVGFEPTVSLHPRRFSRPVP